MLERFLSYGITSQVQWKVFLTPASITQICPSEIENHNRQNRIRKFYHSALLFTISIVLVISPNSHPWGERGLKFVILCVRYLWMSPYMMTIYFSPAKITLHHELQSHQCNSLILSCIITHTRLNRFVLFTLELLILALFTGYHNVDDHFVH